MANEERPFAQALARLRTVNLRPTRQRLALVRLLFENGDRHVSAELLHAQALSSGVKISLATVYNTLHQFTDVGLLKRLVVDGGKTYFDTNIDDHHHFFVEEDGTLLDISAEGISVEGLPALPPGLETQRVDVIVRVKRAAETRN